MQPTWYRWIGGVTPRLLVPDSGACRFVGCKLGLDVAVWNGEWMAAGRHGLAASRDGKAECPRLDPDGGCSREMPAARDMVGCCRWRACVASSSKQTSECCKHEAYERVLPVY